jgi:hypothetical protein
VSTYTIAPFGVQGFSTGDISICMSTVLIGVPVLTVVLTIARVSLGTGSLRISVRFF